MYNENEIQTMNAMNRVKSIDVAKNIDKIIKKHC